MLTNFVSVLGILLVAAFVVMGIYFLVERIGGLVAVKRWEKTHQSRPNYIPYNHYERRSYIPSNNHCVKCSREWTLSSLETRINDIENKLGFIDDEEDENLVDIVKYLRHDVDNITDAIKLHDDLIKQLYSDRDEDVNKIADQINRLDDIITNKSEEDSDGAKLDA